MSSGFKWGHVESCVSYGAKWDQVGTSEVKLVKQSQVILGKSIATSLLLILIFRYLFGK